MAAGRPKKARKAAAKARARKKEGTERTKYTCANAECKLRRKGCAGYEGCPGFKSR